MSRDNSAGVSQHPDSPTKNKSGVSEQAISLPSGGGALQGTGGNYMTNLQTGAGTNSIPIDLPAGRNGLQPEVTLSYSTGNGHGIAGMGWSLGAGSIQRKTSDGVPVYDNSRDTFMSGSLGELVAEDQHTEDDGTVVTNYRPRSEDTFARITHYTSSTTDYWTVEQKDGTVQYYGTPDQRGSDPAVVADPDNRTNVFSWHLTATEDPFGNRIEYDYRRDTGETDDHCWDHLALEEIRYVDYETADVTAFLISVEFEYDPRPDPHSTYVAGFEERTRERLSRIAVRTHADQERTIRSYELTYRDELEPKEQPANGASLLARATVVGHKDGETERLPPIEFEYTEFSPEDRDFEVVDGALPTRSLAAPDLELADLSGNGLPDIVEIDEVVRYWENRGNGRFSKPRSMADAPGGVSLGDPAVQLLDADGDGRIDLVSLDQRLAGYFPLERDGGWSRESFRRYEQVPSVPVDTPAVQLLDLTGDGVTDMLHTGSSLQYFFQDATDGWNAVRSNASQDLEGIDQLNFADPRMRLGDLSGDGMIDIVRISNGHVSYWPNKGHGNWGRRVHMQYPPEFPHDYDPSRLVVGDIDGDGVADLVYVEDNRVRVWINQCGNAWSDPLVIRGTPRVSNTDAIRLVDLKGRGMAGLLYSDGGRSDNEQMYYLDFVGGQKPYLMNETQNNRGLTTRVKYAPSTEFLLADERAGTEWKTSLPQPTWVVSTEESIDQVSQRKQTVTYRYHHGYWDGVEREFRGFGMVEQRDTTALPNYNSDGLHGDEEFTKVPPEQFSPPTLTKTWFHLGPVGPEHGSWRELDYGDEYWGPDPSQLSRPEQTRELFRRLGRRDQRDAVRTLAGKRLRSEVYALDGSERQHRPYRVTEQEFGIRAEGPPPEQRVDETPIFFPHQRSSRSTHWERGDDPMTQFSFRSDYDEYGQPRANISITCPQGWRHDQPTSTSDYQANYTVVEYATETEDRYMVDRVARQRSYTVVTEIDRTLKELRAAIEDETVTMRLAGASRNHYDGDAFEGRPIGELGDYGALVRTEELVLTDELLEAAHPDGNEPHEIGVPAYLTADDPTWAGEYPDGFRTSVHDRGGYVTHDIGEATDLSGATTGYFAVTTQVAYDFQTTALDTDHGLLQASRDPLDRETTILAYDLYDLNPLKTEDPAELETEAAFDYAAMQYWQVTGPNGNQSQTRFSPLGLVTARMDLGDPDEQEGDTPEQPSVQYEYNFHSFWEGADDEVTPASVHTIKRKRHRWDLVEKRNEERAADGLPPLSDTEIEALFEAELERHPERFVQERSYVDGNGNTIQTRGQAEPEVFTDTDGDDILPTDQSIDPDSTVIGKQTVDEEPRVRVSGWKTYNNKGKVIEAFEPFYDTGWEFTTRAETRRELPEAFGHRVTVYYDALDRQVRTVAPDGSERRVVRGDPSPDLDDPATFEPTPWVTYHYSAVDNAGRTHQTEAHSYEHRWNTPTSTHVDLGERKQITVTRNRQPDETGQNDIEERRTVVQYDPWTNEVRHTDELGREAITTIGDLAGRALRTESQDAGSFWHCRDAAGSVLERRDGKGSVHLQQVDEHGRPTRNWARDDPNEPITLRQRIVYGEDAPIDHETARDRNLLGNVYKGYDESGQTTIDAYEFTGKPRAVRQELLGDDIVAGGPVDWTPAPDESWSDREETLLSGREYESSYEHDALGRLQIQRYPDDVAGRSMEAHMEYTPAGSLTGAELVVNPGESDETRERYLEAVGRDPKERPVMKAFGNGVMTRMAYDEATKRLQRQRIETYEVADSTDTEQTVLDTTGTVYQDIAYTYDVGGNVLESREHALGVGVAGTPQQTHQGSELVYGRDTLVRAFRYDAIGQLRVATGRECTSIGQPRGWGDSQGCGFDDFEGTPDVGRGNAPDQTAMYTEEYEYDPAGNMLSLQHTQRTDDSTTNQWTRHFGYAGQSPKDWNPSPGDGPTGSNKLTHVGDEEPTISAPTHEYDAVGNLVSERNATFEWDYADRLTSYREVKNGSVSVEASYAYASGGQRAKKVVDKGEHRREVTEYVGGIEYHRLETDRTSDGGTVKENNSIDVAGVARKRVGTPFDEDVTFAESDRPAVEYTYGDRTGGTSIVVDGEGGWMNREEYTPFGETTFGGYDRKRYRYMGSERDEESGLYYQGARYYAPWLCRWSTTDPAGPQDGLNLYGYVANDPVNRMDPQGTDSSKKEESEEDVPIEYYDFDNGANVQVSDQSSGPGGDTDGSNDEGTESAGSGEDGSKASENSGSNDEGAPPAGPDEDGSDEEPTTPPSADQHDHSSDDDDAPGSEVGETAKEVRGGATAIGLGAWQTAYDFENFMWSINRAGERWSLDVMGAESRFIDDLNAVKDEHARRLTARVEGSSVTKKHTFTDLGRSALGNAAQSLKGFAGSSTAKLGELGTRLGAGVKSVIPDTRLTSNADRIGKWANRVGGAATFIGQAASSPLEGALERITSGGLLAVTFTAIGAYGKQASKRALGAVGLIDLGVDTVTGVDPGFVGVWEYSADTTVAYGKGLAGAVGIDSLFGTEFDAYSDLDAIQTKAESGGYGLSMEGWSMIMGGIGRGGASVWMRFQ